MCGRYVRSSGEGRYREQFGAESDPGGTEHADWRPRFNQAPRQWAPVIRALDGSRRIGWLRWGLVPSWARDEDVAFRTINARAESAARLPAFRAAFRSRRCIVPADAFYEWQPVPGATRKQPWYIHRRDGELLAMAGLWEHWQAPGAAAALETFTILTTGANAWMAPVHDRMPVILDAAGVAAWLAPSTSPPDLQALLRPAPEDALTRYPVGFAVGNPRHDSAALIEPVAAE